MSHAAVLAEVRKAVKERATEPAERNAVARVLAKHGWAGMPKIASARAGDGRAVRIYRYEKTPAGDFALITGPNAEGEVVDMATLDAAQAKSGVYVAALEATSAVVRETKATVARVQEIARDARKEEREPRETRAREPRESPTHYIVPPASARSALPHDRPSPGKVHPKGREKAIFQPILTPQDRCARLAGRKAEVNFGGDLHSAFCISTSINNAQAINQRDLGEFAEKGKNWIAIAVFDRKAAGQLHREFLPRIDGLPGYYDSSLLTPGQFLELGADRSRTARHREFFRVLEVLPDQVLIRTAEGIPQKTPRSVQEELTDLDAALEGLDSETEDAPKESKPRAEEVEIPSYIVQGVQRSVLPHSMRARPGLRGSGVRYGEGHSFEPVGGWSGIADETALIPRVVADTVVQEVTSFLPESSFDTTAAIEHLTTKADQIYRDNAEFKKKVRSKSGREHLYSFMRHWLAAYLMTSAPSVYEKLPSSFANGEELPQGAESGSKPLSRSVRAPEASAPASSNDDAMMAKFQAALAAALSGMKKNPDDMHGRDVEVFGHTVRTTPNGKVSIVRDRIVRVAGDYGSDPVLDEAGNPTGYVRLIPSGVVILASDARKLRKNPHDKGEVQEVFSVFGNHNIMHSQSITPAENEALQRVFDEVFHGAHASAADHRKVVAWVRRYPKPDGTIAAVIAHLTVKRNPPFYATSESAEVHQALASIGWNPQHVEDASGQEDVFSIRKGDRWGTVAVPLEGRIRVQLADDDDDWTEHKTFDDASAMAAWVGTWRREEEAQWARERGR